MKKSLIVLALSGLITLPMHANAQSKTEATTPPTIEEARSIVQQFGGELKPALQKSMKEGGPVGSIDFCHTKAPQIAHDLSEKTGWNVNRVSLKPRGATATADQWETAVLEKFNEQLAANTPIQSMEFSEVVTVDGAPTFRYMRAVGTEEVCLKCHGTDVAAPVGEALHKLYPNDTATGYSKGQIRGAFSFSKAI